MLSIYDSTGILIYCIVVALLIGLVLGSFLNCAAYRTVHHESFIKGRSHCTSCGHELSILDLFPVFSWLFLKGRCRYCKTKISVRYPLTELAFGLLSVCVLLRFDLTIEALRNYILICCLFFLTLTDLEDMTIPDGCIIIPIVVFALSAYFLGYTWKDVLFHVIALFVYGGGMLLLSLIMDKILKKDSLGGGDIKLFAVMGLYLGLLPSLFTLLLSCILGLLISVIMKRTAKGDEEGHFPFGPAIAFSMVIMLFFGNALVNSYLSLFH